ncbi:unnamed protein product [Rhodiola kirilowii]
MTSVDVELLQLPEVPTFAVESTPSLVDDLFSQWLALPGTNRLVKTLISDGKAGAALNSGSSMNATASPTNSLPPLFKNWKCPTPFSESVSGSPSFYETEGWTIFSGLSTKTNQ